MNNHPIAITEIPIEVLFSIIGALVTALGVLAMLAYKDLKREVQLNRKEAASHRVRMASAFTYLRLLCEKAGIPFHVDDGGGD
jgi:hypothetical protein